MEMETLEAALIKIEGKIMTTRMDIIRY